MHHRAYAVHLKSGRKLDRLLGICADMPQQCIPTIKAGYFHRDLCLCLFCSICLFLVMSTFKDVFIVSACQMAICSYDGSLKDVAGCNLGAIVIREAVKRAGIDPALVGDVRFGCCVAHHDGMTSFVDIFSRL